MPTLPQIRVASGTPLTAWVLQASVFKCLFREDRLKVHFADRARMAVTAAYDRHADHSDSKETMEPLPLLEIEKEVVSDRLICF